MSQNNYTLIIGGAGYIGSRLTRNLIKQGGQVRVLDALLYDNSFALADLNGEPGFSLVTGDFRSAETLSVALDGITEVVMLAALVGDPICRQYPVEAKAINETGTLQLIDRLADKGLKRFVFMSTCSNYGRRDTEAEATETDELKPQSLYAETKVCVERYLAGRFNQLGFSATILRAATAYGLSPRMRFDLTVNEFTRELALAQELLVYDADTWRPYCHVADIAETIVAVLKAPDNLVSGEIFNVGRSGENYTKRMLVELLLKQLPEAQVYYREGSTDPRNYRVDFTKLADRLAIPFEHTVPGTMPGLIAAIGKPGHPFSDQRANAWGNYTLG